MAEEIEAEDRPGRNITIPFQRQKVVWMQVGLALFLIALGIGIYMIPEEEALRSSRGALARLVGWALVPIGVFFFLLAYRTATYPLFYLRITRQKIELPRMTGLVARQDIVSFSEITDVGYVSNRGGDQPVVWVGDQRYPLGASAWLPKPWTVHSLVRRVSLRWAAAQRHLKPWELAAIEAAWDDEQHAGVAVRRKGKKWKLLAKIEDESDFEDRVERGNLPEDAEPFLADELLPDWRTIRDMQYLPKPKKGWFS